MININNKILNLYKTAVAEGTVLLKNRNNLLPLENFSRIAIFGRTQFEYYKSGTGSGRGASNAKRCEIFDALKNHSEICIDDVVSDLYRHWIDENPFDDGGGVWAGEPWSQKEMPLDDDFVKEASLRNDVAIIIIGRSAGEDHDNSNESGSYCLTEVEEDTIKKVSTYFKKVFVALNTGNIMDLSFLDKYDIDALMYLWQGGMCGAEAFADIVTGNLTPSGKLTDTQVYDIKDYPCYEDFFNERIITYAEDVYVGYRYFETFSEKSVRFPFGYGLTYTNFDSLYSAFRDSNNIVVNAEVKNIGNYSGKEIVQVYYGSPSGNLGTPSKQLISFAKTKELRPNESTQLTLSFPIADMSAFDDCGDSGYKSCYVLQKGNYDIFVGTDVRNTKKVFSITVDETTVTEKLEECLAPDKPFMRFKAVDTEKGKKLELADVPLSTVDIEERIKSNIPADIPYTGDKGIKLLDVKNGKSTLDEFVAQLSNRELAQLVCGEGMSSPKATPGAGGAIGGLTEELAKYGIPVCAVSDGPSGIRIKSDKEISLVPNGTLLASTWNVELVQKVYEQIGEEVKTFELDALLGPGINIHRNPLCGRNFEYFSEDPYLSGKMAVAATLGVAKSGSYSTIKHFCCNNREKLRSDYDVYVSERALREIYLKPFEMAVKKGKNVLIMTAYNKVNGYYCASDYDLTSYILRKQWKFDNFVMTDWWARCNTERYNYGDKLKLQAMVKAQNDVYMVCSDSRVKAESIVRGLESGYITIGQLQESAKNLLRFILDSHTFKNYIKSGCKPKYPLSLNVDGLNDVVTIKNPESGKTYDIDVKSGKPTAFLISLYCEENSLAQVTIDAKVDNSFFPIIVGDTSKKVIEVIRALETEWVKVHQITLKYPDSIRVDSVIIKQ